MNFEKLFSALIIFTFPLIAIGKTEEAMTFPSKHISIGINCSSSDVYEFASKPENMPKWAAGLSGSILKEGDHWVSLSPMGKVKVKFTDTNKFGVIDHDVTVESGKTFHNPLRVIKNNDGAEVVFTLYKQPEMSEKEFDRDAGMVSKDLAKLKAILENTSTR